jgi:hypothetical protein
LIFGKLAVILDASREKWRGDAFLKERSRHLSGIASPPQRKVQYVPSPDFSICNRGYRGQSKKASTGHSYQEGKEDDEQQGKFECVAIKVG